MTPRNWRECVKVDVTATHVRRWLSCEHPPVVKPLEFLNETARRDPQAMKGQSFECPDCRKEAERDYLPRR